MFPPNAVSTYVVQSMYANFLSASQWSTATLSLPCTSLPSSVDCDMLIRALESHQPGSNMGINLTHACPTAFACAQWEASRGSFYTSEGVDLVVMSYMIDPTPESLLCSKLHQSKYCKTVEEISVGGCH